VIDASVFARESRLVVFAGESMVGWATLF